MILESLLIPGALAASLIYLGWKLFRGLPRTASVQDHQAPICRCPGCPLAGHGCQGLNHPTRDQDEFAVFSDPESSRPPDLPLH